MSSSSSSWFFFFAASFERCLTSAATAFRTCKAARRQSVFVDAPLRAWSLPERSLVDYGRRRMATPCVAWVFRPSTNGLADVDLPGGGETGTDVPSRASLEPHTALMRAPPTVRPPHNTPPPPALSAEPQSITTAATRMWREARCGTYRSLLHDLAVQRRHFSLK